MTAGRAKVIVEEFVGNLDRPSELLADIVKVFVGQAWLGRRVPLGDMNGGQVTGGNS